MDTIGEDDVLMLSVSIFKIIGEGNRHHEDKFIYIFRLINICMFIWNLIIALASISSAKGFVYIKIMESAITFCHGILKYICFIYYKSDIEILLDDLRLFWRTNGDEELNRKANLVYKYLSIGQRVYMAAAIVFMLIYIIRPCFDENERFIFASWPILNSTVAETFVLFCQYYILLIFASIVYAYDTFYLAYAFRVIIQLKLLKYTFERVAHDDDAEKLYKCIKQHQLLLCVFDRMRKVYFWMLLLYYGIVLVTSCSELYVALIAQPGPVEVIASVIYLMAMLVEFGGYTILVEEIVFQLKDLSRAVYMSNWYDRRVDVRQDLLIVMMKSQRQKYLSAAGMIEMNVDTLASVIRKIFSFYVILRNVLKK